jgi:FkbM family methyltransferase
MAPAPLGTEAVHAVSYNGYSGNECMVSIDKWKPSRKAQILEALASPAVRLLNRPSLMPLSHLLFDFSLRCLGVGNNAENALGITWGEERFLRALAARGQLTTVLDIGANRGGYARAIKTIAPNARVISVEPHPTTYAALCEEVRGTDIETVNSAVSDMSGELLLHDFAEGDGSTQASLDPAVIRFHGNGEVVSHPVKVTTLDELVQEKGLSNISLIKIDTEGFDLNVLRGARQLIANKSARYIQFEVISSNVVRRISVADFFEALPGHSLNRIALNGELLPLGRYNPKFHEIAVRHNLVAVPD